MSSDVWKQFLETPGASSDDMSWYKLTPSKPVKSEVKSSDGWLDDTKLLLTKAREEAKRLKAEAEAKRANAKAKAVILNTELAEIMTGKSKKKIVHEQMAEVINLLKDGSVFELSAPQSLTVLDTATGRYSKESHMGMETFVVDSVYIGKKGVAIVKLKPQSSARYDIAEMELMHMESAFKGAEQVFTGWLGMSLKSYFNKGMSDQTAKVESKLDQVRATTYEGFGSW